MRNNGIEDIVIGSPNNSNKNVKKVIIIILILLLLILVSLIFAYKYFTKETITAKQLFFNHLSATNIKPFINNDIYEKIYSRLTSENSEITTNINFSSNNEPESLQEFDLSKFALSFTNNNDIQNSKIYTELGVNYSGNEVLKFKLLADKEKIAITSDEILDNYIGIHYKSIEDTLGIKYNKKLEEIFKNSEKIELTDEEKNNYLKTYVTKISENIPDEKFTIQENIVIDKNAQTINVTAYNLTLSQEELKNSLVNLLTNIKNDEELLKKLVTGKKEILENSEGLNSNSEINQENNEELNTNSEINEEADKEQNSISNIDQENDESLNSNIETNEQTNRELETNTILEEGTSTELNSSQTIDLENDNLENQQNSELNSIIGTDSNLNFEINEFYEDITNIMIGNKINKTVEEVQKDLDKYIENINNLQGDGLKITIYVSEKGTEKINIVLPNNNTADLEFSKINEEEIKLKITYLYNGTTPEFNFDNEEVKTYSAEDNIVENIVEDNSVSRENLKNGFSLELTKIQKDANTTIKAIYNFIENEKINKKININLKTEGTNNSKTLNNDIVVIVSTNKSEDKIVIDNNIKFETTQNIEDLTDENCLFIENLSEEELNNKIQEISQKTETVLEEKKKNLNLIETNTHGSIVQQNLDKASYNVTYDEARQALIDKVSTMMGEAQARNEEFTIQNLVDLQIEGYEVSSMVNEQVAKIVIDVYAFNIDSNFNLTDAE